MLTKFKQLVTWRGSKERSVYVNSFLTATKYHTYTVEKEVGLSEEIKKSTILSFLTFTLITNVKFLFLYLLAFLFFIAISNVVSSKEITSNRHFFK